MPSVLEIWVKPEVDPPKGRRAAARVSFTVETTVLPSFALRAGRVIGRASSSYCAFFNREMVLTDLVFSAAEEKKCAERDAYEGPGARFGNG